MLASMLHLLLTVLGLVAAPDPSAVGLALALAAVAIVAVAVLAGAAPRLSAPSRAHPRSARDVSVPVAQSDPDAAGHSRPRAPGAAAPAA